PVLPLLHDGQSSVRISDKVNDLRSCGGAGTKQLVQCARVVRLRLWDDHDLRGVDGSAQGRKLCFEVVGQANAIGVIDRKDSRVPERAVRVQVAPGDGPLQGVRGDGPEKPTLGYREVRELHGRRGRGNHHNIVARRGIDG